MLVLESPRANIRPHRFGAPLAGFVVDAKAQQPATMALDVQVAGVARINGVTGVGVGLRECF